MKNKIKTLALFTTGFVAGVVVGRVSKKNRINLENYLSHFKNEKIRTCDLKDIHAESLMDQQL